MENPVLVPVTYLLREFSPKMPVSKILWLWWVHTIKCSNKSCADKIPSYRFNKTLLSTKYQIKIEASKKLIQIFSFISTCFIFDNILKSDEKIEIESQKESHVISTFSSLQNLLKIILPITKRRKQNENHENSDKLFYIRMLS